MTVICAATGNGVHAIAADGRSTAGDEVVADRADKLIRWGDELVIGVAGETMVNNLVARMTTDSSPAGPEAFAMRLKAAMNALGWKYEDETGSPNAGFACAYLTSLGVWIVHCSFAVTRVEEEWPKGLGSGGTVAAGAMTALAEQQRHRDPEELVIAGVNVARRLITTCGGGTRVAVRGTVNHGPEWL